jgi:alginate O-acetyltransferase complex protein AlgI
LLHGVYLILQRAVAPVWRRLVRFTRLPGLLNHGIEVAVVYSLTLLAWVYFRSGSIGLAGGDSFATANQVISGIGGLEGFSLGAVVNKFQVVKGFVLIGILLAIELTNVRYHWNVRQVQQPGFRMAAFAVLLWLIAFFGTFGSNAFIYFQF